MCGVISGTPKRRTMEETDLEVYKVMAVPFILYVSETWTLKNIGWNIIRETVKCCSRHIN
jgi:hypothetical protein